MKHIFYILLFALFLAPNFSSAQEVTINENTVIKDDSGKRVKLESFMSMINSGDWTIRQEKDEDGNEFLQLVKTTPKQKKEMLKMMKNMQLGDSESDLTGTKAPDFEFTDIDGNLINSENTKGKIVVMNFWFAACKPCIDEIPELNEIYEKYKDNENIVFASVTFEKKTKIETFEKRYPIRYPVVGEARAEISKFNVMGYPTNLIIGKDGNFSFHTTGGFAGIGATIEEGIEEALKK